MRLPAALLVLAVIVACGGDDTADTTVVDTTDTTVTDTTVTDTAGDEGCADVIDAEIEPEGDGTFSVSATVASADTGPEKYADAWEVRSEDGEVLGVRELLHPHVDEQPFTRSLTGVEIPDDVERVALAARDSAEGFCGETFELEVP